MNNTIKCSNPECKVDNPAYAKFCRKCGHAIITERGEYTPDMFPDIELHPVSVNPIRFVIGWEKFSFFVLPILTFFIIAICDEYKIELRNAVGEDDWLKIVLVSLFFAFIFAISSWCGLKQLCKQFKYAINADFIEGKCFMHELKRIARKRNLGLFDEKSQKVLLESKYEAISKFDDQHILLRKNGKIGIYSLTRKRIIVPIVFDEIQYEEIGAFSAVRDMQVFHYDLLGKELR